VDSAFHAFFIFIAYTALKLVSFVLRLLTVFTGFWLTCNGLVLPLLEDQPRALYWSMIRCADYTTTLDDGKLGVETFDPTWDMRKSNK
jgi:hypothetical protein